MKAAFPPQECFYSVEEGFWCSNLHILLIQTFSAVTANPPDLRIAE